MMLDERLAVNCFSLKWQVLVLGETPMYNIKITFFMLPALLFVMVNVSLP